MAWASPGVRRITKPWPMLVTLSDRHGQHELAKARAFPQQGRSMNCNNWHSSATSWPGKNIHYEQVFGGTFPLHPGLRRWAAVKGSSSFAQASG